MEKPVADLELEQAVTCRLIESDGSRWEVQDVTLEDGRAWVRAAFLPSIDGNGTGEEHDAGPPSADVPSTRTGDQDPRVFDTVLTSGVRLVWHLQGGRRVIARGNGDGSLEWTIEATAEGTDPREPTPTAGFFRDPFLDA